MSTPLPTPAHLLFTIYPLPESTLSPSKGFRIWPLERKKTPGIEQGFRTGHLCTILLRGWMCRLCVFKPLTNDLYRNHNKMSLSKNTFDRCLLEFTDWRYRQSCWHFRPRFENCCLSNILFGSTLPLTPFPCVNKYTVYTYTVRKRGWGYWVLGLRQINTLQVNFFRWQRFALPSIMSLIFLQFNFKSVTWLRFYNSVKTPILFAESYDRMCHLYCSG